MVVQVTRKQRKVLRRIAGRAYERELAVALEQIEGAFGEWREGKIDVWEVENRIHEHHQGISRELWKRYNYLDPQETVGQAIYRGVIKLDEIPEDLQDFATEKVERIKEFLNFTDDQE